ncbi:sterile alpha motif domain-containing protein 1-like [Podarcis raffonei]|uniref:sterile alpha motif domain-containing protein 1-like n=1 Tax=Podarcis raffonei TaxID=65483 RepID=UPI0023296367|nr:sterile alpha motif domain-containing protein 1-like [Podarcis raffonei]
MEKKNPPEKPEEPSPAQVAWENCRIRSPILTSFLLRQESLVPCRRPEPVFESRGPHDPSTRAPAQAPRQPPRQAPAQPPRQAPAQAPRQALAQPPRQAPAQPPRQPPRQAPAQPPRQAPAQAPAQPPRQAPRQAPAQPPRQAPAQPPRQAPAQPPRQAPAQAPAQRRPDEKKVPPGRQQAPQGNRQNTFQPVMRFAERATGTWTPGEEEGWVDSYGLCSRL